MPAFVAVCELLHRRGFAGATTLLGVDGTAHGERRRARFFARNADVPMMIIAVGEGTRVADALPEVGALLGHPLVTLERVRVCKRDGERLARPPALPGADEHGLALWQKLMIYSSERARHGGRPLHRELVRRLRRADVSGATSLRGIWGFHGHHPPHGDKLLQLHRHVPVVTIVVDTPERVAGAFDIVDELTEEQGLVTSEIVPAMAAMTETVRRGGLRLSRYDGRDRDGSL
jgi:PII-like signaling protein